MTEALAPLLVAFPLAMAALLAALHRIAPRWLLDLLAIAAALATCAAAAWLAMRAAAAGAPLPVWMGGWEPRGGAAFGIALAPDALGAGFAALIALLVAATLLVSRFYFTTLGGLFQALLLVFLGAASGFCITGDLFNLYVFFELIGVTAFVLTAYRMAGVALHGAFAFAVTNSIGGLLVLTGTGVLYAVAGTVNLAELSRLMPTLGDAAPVRLAFALILVGFLVKAACVPFQFWLADAYAAAAAPVCVLFGGASVTLGVFGIARLTFTVFAGAEDGAPPLPLAALLLPLGLATALLGAALALVELNLKRLLALTTVSHVGVLLVALASGSAEALAGGAAYLLGHALVKAGLFAGVAVLALRLGSTDTQALRGRARGLPVTGLLLALGGLLLAGMPPGAILLGKEGVLHAAEAAGSGWAGPLLLVASAVSGAAVLRAVAELWLAPPAGEPPQGAGSAWAGAAIAAIGLALVATNLASPLLGLGPALHAAAESFASPARYAAAVLEGASAAQPMPSAAMEAGGLLGKLVPPLAALVLGALVAWRGMLPAVPARLLALPLGAARRLQALHTGHVGDYVAWLVAGLGGIGVAVALLPWR